MQLAILIAVLAALAQSESPDTLPVEGLLWRVGLVFAGILVAPLVAACGSLSMARAFAAGRFHQQFSYSGYQFLQRLAISLWLLSSGVVLYVLQWPAIVRVNWSLASWPLVDELCILAPILLPLGLLWLAFYQVENAAHRAVAARTGSHERTMSAGSYLLLQVRHQLGLALLPALAVIAGQELLAKFAPDLVNDPRSWWLCLPLVAALLLTLPLFLRGIWRTTPLPNGALRSRLEAACREHRCQVRDLLIWHTNEQIANALVAGFTPWLRYVFLTDGLLVRLNDAELEAVVRHETGHVARRHLPLRMLLLTLPLAAYFALQTWYPEVIAAVPRWLAELGVVPSLQSSLLLPAMVVGYAVAAVGSYSRWLEHDADLAVILRGNREPDAATANDFISALHKVSGGVAESRLGQWLHPPTERRTAYLRQVLHDPALGQQFQRRLDYFAGFLIALYALAALLVLLG